MKLKQTMPPGRTIEGLLNHYRVEKAIAQRLKAADRDGRAQIYRNMYAELFERVPDHSRLTRRTSQELSDRATRAKFGLVERFLLPDHVFVEFAPGDCRFSYECARRVQSVYGVDISDQRESVGAVPENFQLVIYDGYEPQDPAAGAADVVFSDQLIEHLHPDDTRHHFELVHRLLKPGGLYVFRTPHWLTGPHDVSRYFSDEPECFHLKEWTYRELYQLVSEIGYSKFQARWEARGVNIGLPYSYFNIVEMLLSRLPKSMVRRVAKPLVPSVYGVAVK